MHQLAAIVGADNISKRDGVLRVAPAEEQEVAAVLRSCNEHGWVVTPTCGGTKLDWGNPVQANVLLDLRRLAGVREHVWQDLTATVLAGTSWSDMQAALGQNKQRVALDPLFGEQASVGGVLATNDSGSLRWRYGSLRDLVLGLTVVLADGTVARSGGKVVKNVAGYDLPKLMTGSFGTLAVITEVTFRLHGLPVETAGWTIRGSILRITRLMQALLGSEFSVEAMQLRSLQLGFAVDVRFAAASDVLRQNELLLHELAAGCEIVRSASSVWQEREKLFSIAGATVVKITALPSKLAVLMTGFAELSRLGSVSATCVADPVGIVTATLEGQPAAVADVVEDLRARLSASGGMVVVLRPGVLDPELDRWGGSVPAIEVMRAIKKEFDGSGTLNPGKFVGGI